MATKVATRSASCVGMMEGAFFVSRTELLSWVNRVLQVSLTKVEQCASGAIYCQILDACHPGSVAMRKVNWMAKADHEFIPNYKALQAAFDKLEIEKHIDVDRLIRAKYQDNLEFLQWMKCYWDRERSACEDYDPLAPREAKLVPAWARPTSALAAALSPPPAHAHSPGAHDKENTRPRTAGAANATHVAAHHRDEPRKALSSRPVSTSSSNAKPTPRVSAPNKVEQELAKEACEMQSRMLEECRAKVVSQGKEIEEMGTALDGLERERDYYFQKLRQVEVLCSTLQAQMDCEHALDLKIEPRKIIEDIQGILYAAVDEEGEDQTLVCT